MEYHQTKYSLNNPKVIYCEMTNLYEIVDDDGYVVNDYCTKDEAVEALFELIACI